MAVWFAAFLPIIYIWHFSPCYSSASAPPPGRPQCVMFSSWCPCVLIVQLPLMSENMQCLVFCFCVSLLRMLVSSFLQGPGKDINSSFLYRCILFHGIYMPHFVYLVYHWLTFGLVPCFFYCEQCWNKHICACVFITECFIFLWVYT